LEADEQPRPADEPDPELIALAGGGTRPSILRPILMIAVIVLGGWIISDWKTELEYYVSDAKPIELGDALDFAAASDADIAAKLPHNRYVSITGIPTQRSQSTRYRFFRLVGAPVFVEEPRDDVIEDPLQRELEGDVKGDVDRTMFRGAGRLTKFSEMPERYGGLRHYYRTRYNITFCEELTPQAFAEVKRRKRDAIIGQLRSEYEDATPEERELRKLQPNPSDALVDDLLADDPVCIEAWLLQDQMPPSEHLWYLVATLMFLGFMLFNVGMLVRWVRAFARS
jgi:hypothetical protein